ncbi:MAG: hypothetical protein WAL97_10280 [Halobacteriota archaeon]
MKTTEKVTKDEIDKEFAAKRLAKLDTAIKALEDLGPHSNYGALSTAIHELNAQKKRLQA